MRMRVLIYLCLLGAAGARAEALAPTHDAASGCVTAQVEVLAGTGGQALYRINFVNRCGAPRNLYWCADHPGAPVPPAVVCPRGRGFVVEPRHALVHRKEFQWHLPRGSRIRYHACQGQDLPTAEFGCATP
jgi:hypothetical protein